MVVFVTVAIAASVGAISTVMTIVSVPIVFTVVAVINAVVYQNR